MRNYVNSQEFIKRAGISRSKLYRTYKESPEIWRETTIKNGRRLIPEKHLKYFDRELLYQDNRSMRNLMDCLRDKESLPYRLWYLDWTYFITISYRLLRDKDACASRMRQLYDEIENEFGNQTKLRMFFTSEPFINRKGYHNHVILNVKEKRHRNAVLKLVKEAFKYDRIDKVPYDYRLGAIFYTAKKGLDGTEWDLLGNNFEQEGLDYESKSK